MMQSDYVSSDLESAGYIDKTMDVLKKLGRPCTANEILKEIVDCANRTDDLDLNQNHSRNITEKELRQELKKARYKLRKLGLINLSPQNFWQLTESGHQQLEIGWASCVVKLNKAWLITWDGFDTLKPDKLIDDQDRIALILPSYRSSQYVEDILSHLYSQVFDSIRGLVATLKKQNPPPMTCRRGGIKCGHSSLYLHARVVDDLFVQPEYGNFERIKWIEQEVWGEVDKESHKTGKIRDSFPQEIRRKACKVGIPRGLLESY